MSDSMTNQSSYVLPVVDVCEQRRNFPGYHKYENMLPLVDEGGTTETDSKTDPKGSDGYSSMQGMY